MALNSPKTRITGFFNPIKKAVTDVGGAILASPVTIPGKIKAKRMDRDIATLKRARAYDNAPDHDEQGNPTDAFKARSMADMVRMRRMPKK